MVKLNDQRLGAITGGTVFRDGGNETIFVSVGSGGQVINISSFGTLDNAKTDMEPDVIRADPDLGYSSGQFV